MIELEKIDIIRTRLNVSYKEAKAALEAADGDVLQALIDLEEKQQTTTEWERGFQEKGSDFLDQVKGAFNKNRGYRVKIKHGEQTVAEIPASLGALGLLGAMASYEIAVVGVLASVAGLANKYSLEIERTDAAADPEDSAKEQSGEDI